MQKKLLCFTQKHIHVFHKYLSGPGGEDLEGGYYDAGDNLKVVCDDHQILITDMALVFINEDTFRKCNSENEAECHDAGYISIMC